MVDYVEDDDKTNKSRKRGDGTPVLDNFSKDLIKAAEEGKLDNAIGRDSETKRLARILARRKKNNPIIIGEAGSGKTNLVEGLAILMQKGECPKNLQGKRLVSLDLNSVVAGTKYRGQFEERMKVIIDELKSNPNIILFIDEIHTLVGSGNSAGSMDGANIFKPSLASGEIQCIGATTAEEYRKFIEKDKALERRFQTIYLEPPTVEETITILKNSKSRYEKFHKATYSDEVIEACVKLADRYIHNRVFPDKAFDILDEVGAKLLTDVKLPEHIEELRNRAAEILRQKKDLVRNQEYEKAAELRDIESKVIKELNDEKAKFDAKLSKDKKVATLEDVYEVVSMLANVPVTSLNHDEKNYLKNLSQKLKNYVVGQDEAVEKISKAIRRSRVGVKDPNKPSAYIFLGNTGVGKTHLAKQIAKEIFSSEDALIRIDMSEYQERFNISRLIGSPPGYVDSDKSGELTEKVRKKPYSVVLFDEVEKAHRDIFSLFLQILDDGYVTDAMGRKVIFKNCLIILTSNIGVKKLRDFGTGIGFTKSNDEEVKRDILLKEMKSLFSPEFLNRIDDTIVFNQLTKEDIEKIASIEIKKLENRLKDMGYSISFNSNISPFITELGYSDEYAARNMKRLVQNKVEDFITDLIIDDNIEKSENYEIFVNEDEINFKKL